jgi:hypothetical protein
MQPVERGEIERAVSLFFAPGGRYAIQALRSGWWEIVHADDTNEIVATVEGFADQAGVYFGMNPLRPGFVKPVPGPGETGKGWYNPDVDCRRWLLVDIDPVKPSELPKATNTTESEKAEASAVVGAVIARLSRLGWPVPIIVDSGNGYHLYWRVDLANDKLSQQAISKFLKRLAGEVDTAGAKIDKAVHDAKRIAKLPGTWSRKGPHSDERPWRMCRILSVPPTSPFVSYEMIATYAGLKGEAEPREVGWTLPTPSTGGGYAHTAMANEIGKLVMTTEGRQTALYNAALKLGNFVGSGELREDEVVSRLTATGVAIGLGTDGDPDEIRRAIHNGIEQGKQSPRTAPEKAASGPAAASAKPLGSNVQAAVEACPGGIVERYHTVKTRRVKWLWPDVIPRGKLTTVAGAGGLGKSFVMCDLAARISVGGEIPFGNGECFDLGKVLIINCEDDPEDTVVPRLIEAGADLTRIGGLRSEAVGKFSLADLPMLDRAVEEMGGVDLIVIDPATAFVGKTDDHKNAELQALLTPLRVKARKMNYAICLITHVAKSSGGNIEAAARVIGGVAWVNAVRAAMIFCRDPKDRKKRLVIPFKTNNGPEAEGFRYSIESTDSLARVNWEGRVDISADEAMSAGAKRDTERHRTEEEIAAFIKRFFVNARRVAAGVIKEHAKEDGFKDKTLWLATSRLGITKRKEMTETGQQAWFWYAPEKWADEMEIPT